MKTKFLLFICVAAALMLFACTDNGVDESESSTKQGVVTISFDFEFEVVSDKIIEFDNPDSSSNLLCQYKAIPDFKLADGSIPIGSTGDEWTDFDSGKEMSFSEGNWIFDVRAVQKGETEDIIVFETVEPVKALITADSAKLITFNLKKKVEGTGNVNIDIVVSNPIEIVNGFLNVNFIGLRNEQSSYTFNQNKGNFNWENGKYYFNTSLKDIKSGFYIIKLVYSDNIESYEYELKPVEVFNGKDTKIKGEIDLGNPECLFFITKKENNESLECTLKLEKRVFYANDKIPFKLDGNIFSFNNQQELENKVKVLKEKKIAKQVNNNQNVEGKNITEQFNLKYFLTIFIWSGSEFVKEKEIKIIPGENIIKLAKEQDYELKAGNHYEFDFKVSAQHKKDDHILEATSGPIRITILTTNN